ncbi:hypothetical protein FACS1894211_01100 [Clostridia bacterium]|nr:hypothetical protein FACS1894211_01100 [Clostridia bacterium]
MFKEAKWIWAKDNIRADDWVLFIKDFDLDARPRKAVLRVYCETKYYLYVNGAVAVFDGGLFRESASGCGYYDSVDIAEFLQKGKNRVTFRVWYFGNGGRNNTSSGAAGLLFESPDLKIFSDSNTKAIRDPAHFITGEPKSSNLYGGHNIGYDARKSVGEFYNLDFDGKDFVPAVEYGAYPCEPWNTAAPRPVPQFRFGNITKVDFITRDGRYVVILPRPMQFTPYFEVEAKGGEIIGVRGDRYETRGGPGDEFNAYRGHRAEYICRNGAQSFEALDWAFGEEIIFTIPDGVKILNLGYRESGYDTDIKPLKTDDIRLNTLFQKCARTLISCMRDNFMDCPDRERGQWIGDVSVQAPQVFYVLSESAVPLLKKAITDFITLRKGDILVGNVPGDNFLELPAQSLNAISLVGMLAEYYRGTHDKEALRLAFKPSVAYLKLWAMKDGLPERRKGDWEWYDHNFNVDSELLSCAWYCSALKFALFMGREINEHENDSFLTERIRGIEESFERHFWKGSFYSGADFADDRANAAAYLAGLVPAERYSAVRKVLISVFNSTTYMENYVLTALCEMGYREDAYKRMMSRYSNVIDSTCGAVPEDFAIYGTYNHAWSGAPLTIVCRYFPELLKQST